MALCLGPGGAKGLVWYIFSYMKGAKLGLGAMDPVAPWTATGLLTLYPMDRQVCHGVLIVSIKLLTIYGMGWGGDWGGVGMVGEEMGLVEVVRGRG